MSRYFSLRKEVVIFVSCLLEFVCLERVIATDLLRPLPPIHSSVDQDTEPRQAPLIEHHEQGTFVASFLETRPQSESDEGESITLTSGILDEFGSTLFAVDERRYEGHTTDAAIQWGGWLAQGYTGNPDQPTNGLNRPVLFNDRANEYLLNQYYLFSESQLLDDYQNWDVMARIDATYGYDSQFVSVPGLERHHDRTRKWNSENERYGLALPQAYIEVAPANSNEFSLKLGHFYSIAGYERFASPENIFYSHSYAFAFATPFTQTGALAAYSPRQETTWYLGYSQGWDIWDSNVDTWGIVGGTTLRSTDRVHELSVVVQVGDDLTNIISGGRSLVDDRVSLHMVYQQQFSEHWRYIVAPVFGSQQNTVTVANLGPSTVSYDHAQWYGVSQYLLWDASEWYVGAFRFEWFRDEDHSRIGVPVEYNPGGPVLRGGNYFALTAGMNCFLTSNIWLRPEIRWDWSDVRGSATVPGGDPTIRAFGDRTDGSQITLASDLVIAF